MARNKPRKARGPSRPIDPRYAPGRPTQNNRDRFGVALVAFGFVFVLVIILVASLMSGNSTTTTATSPSTTGSQSIDPNVQATAQANVVATQVIVDATQTAGLPRIEPAEAIAMHAANNVTMFDVRQQNDYLTSHVTGATNIPEADVSKRMAEIPKTGNVIVYCQWPNDEESARVARTLTQAGYTNVKILHGGFLAWQSAGGPVQSK